MVDFAVTAFIVLGIVLLLVTTPSDEPERVLTDEEIWRIQLPP